MKIEFRIPTPHRTIARYFCATRATIAAWSTLPARIAELERKIDTQSKLIRERIEPREYPFKMRKIKMITEDHTRKSE